MLIQENIETILRKTQYIILDCVEPTDSREYRDDSSQRNNKYLYKRFFKTDQIKAGFYLNYTGFL